MRIAECFVISIAVIGVAVAAVAIRDSVSRLRVETVRNKALMSRCIDTGGIPITSERGRLTNCIYTPESLK